MINCLTVNHKIQQSFMILIKKLPWFWFGRIGRVDAVTTAAWTDEAAAFAIQPAITLALAAAAAGGKGCI